MHFFERRFSLALLSLLACAAGIRAGVAPVFTLLAEAQVATESIYLSDLLPAPTPADIREAAAKISMGSAPPPGGTITLSAAKVASYIPLGAREEVAIPPQIVIHRAARMLTRGEVVAAVNRALQSNRIPGFPSVEEGDIHFSAPVHVSAPDARLEVRRLDIDPALKQARFLLAVVDHRSLPFLVTADLRSAPSEAQNSDATQSGAADLLAALRAAPLTSSSGHATTPDITLVDPRRHANLHVTSDNMQMVLAVVPLEKGAFGQTVRVRVLASGRVLRGRVTGEGRLEARF